MFFFLILTTTLLISKKITPHFSSLFSLLFLFRVTLTGGDGTLIIRTNGTEKAYDTTQPKTVNPFLAYTPNGTVSSVSLP
jgi:hypothetical protein